MEHTLWDSRWEMDRPNKGDVLILVLMEHTLWEGDPRNVWVYRPLGLNPCFNGTYSMRKKNRGWTRPSPCVLILVLMEHTLWEIGDLMFICSLTGLNPCFNGTYSMSVRCPLLSWKGRIGLNPCFNGTYSMRYNTLVYIASLKWS